MADESRLKLLQPLTDSLLRTRQAIERASRASSLSQGTPIPTGVQAPISNLQMGGVVQQTGPYRLHQNETVVPASGLPEGVPNLPPPPTGFQASPSGFQVPIRSFQQGGLVPQTGPYLLHRGEMVVPASQEKPDQRQAYLSKDGQVVRATKNPDPGKFWRLTFSPEEARQAHESGDPAEIPLLYPKSGLTRGPSQRAALAEASRRIQHQDPLRPFGEFLEKLTEAAQAPTLPPLGPGAFAPRPSPAPQPVSPQIPTPYPPRRMPHQEFKGRGIF